MKYEVTKDLETGNSLIDSEHRQLFTMINNLMDACSQGKGRDQINSTMQYLLDYVNKHFGDEEQLQIKSNYPGYSSHKQFHDGYKRNLAQITNEILASGATIASLSKLNQTVSTLISHIKLEDKKLAAHIKAAS